MTAFVLTFFLILLALALLAGALLLPGAIAAWREHNRHSIDARLDDWCTR